MKNKTEQNKENFVQFVRKSENFWELIKRRPSAFVLLSIVAMRAKRTDSTNFNELEIGEAYIGDYKNYGSTEQKYRTDKKFLETHEFLTTKSTTKGTVAKLIDKTIFDINEKKLTNKLTNSQRTPNERLTTNKNEKNIEEIKEENTVASEKEKQFPVVWSTYPKHRNKGQARKAFDKIKNPPIEKMLATIERMKETPDWKKENGKYIPYLSTWLNAEGWEDEAEVGLVKDDAFYINEMREIEFHKFRKKYGDDMAQKYLNHSQI